VSFRTTTCVEIACDLCQYVLDEEGEGVQHHTSEEQAVKSAVHQGWERLADGRVICGDDASDDHVQAREASRAAGAGAVP
jgi:hypothetical protein